MSGNQIYNRGGSEVRVSGQIETVEDLKNTSKYDTVWTLEEEMTATGQNNYHGSGERFDTVVTHNDASERSIRTTTVIASNIPATESTPDGSTLVEVVTLELPGADNTTTFDVTREGTYEQRFISTNTSTGTVHVNALEGSYNGSYVGNSVNEVLNGTLTDNPPCQRKHHCRWFDRGPHAYRCGCRGIGQFVLGGRIQVQQPGRSARTK